MSQAGRRVFLVEDEGVLTIFMEDLLAELGYEIAAVAQTVPDAMEKLDDAAYDMALVDLNLNGERSYPIADRLIAKNVPFAFVTGYGGGGIEPDYASVPTLKKPFDISALESLLGDLSAKSCPG